jgi:hypothetical protein
MLLIPNIPPVPVLSIVVPAPPVPVLYIPEVKVLEVTGIFAVIDEFMESIIMESIIV